MTQIAVAVPACNEAGVIDACIAALSRAAARALAPAPGLVILANNCADQTAARALAFAGRWPGRLLVETVTLPPDRAHAGWARRMALDLAADMLSDPGDIILSTDADTVVAEDWIGRTLAHFAAGYDAVAGSARLDPADLRQLTAAHRLRLAQIRRYSYAIDYLKARQDQSEPWPRHFYEGGASMALTLAAYRAIGGAPTPPVSEDKALFEAVRGVGGKVRHPTDVRVRTSARLAGRAVGGASDTLALWGRQADDEPVAGLTTIAAALGRPNAGPGAIAFRQLPLEIERARLLVNQARRSPRTAGHPSAQVFPETSAA